MITLRAQGFRGRLDVSSPEVLGEPTIEFRKTVIAGDMLTIPDAYVRFPNIRNAITAGFLEVVSGKVPISTSEPNAVNWYCAH